MKKVTVNGQPRETTASEVAGLIAELGFVPGTVMVEHNGTALRPSEWNRPLTEGDQVELLRIAAGG